MLKGKDLDVRLKKMKLLVIRFKIHPFLPALD